MYVINPPYHSVEPGSPLTEVSCRVVRKDVDDNIITKTPSYRCVKSHNGTMSDAVVFSVIPKLWMTEAEGIPVHGQLVLQSRSQRYIAFQIVKTNL